MTRSQRADDERAGEAPAEERGPGPEPAMEASNVAGERGIASINRARSLQSRLSNLLAMGLMSGLGLGLLTWYYAQTFSRQAHARQEAVAASRSRAQGEMPLPALGRVDPPAPAPLVAEAPALERVLGPEPASPPIPTASVGAPALGLGARTAGGGHASPSRRSLARRLAGPVFSPPSDNGSSGAVAEGAIVPAASRSGMLLGASGQSPPGSAGAHEGEAASSADSEGAVAALLRPSVTPAVQARVLPTQPLLLPKGAFIDCTLETAIDSSLPGLTTCITATDTFGADGQVVLLERGTKLVGETRGEVRQGTARVFVLWTEARTPTGVVVPLASPGTDELGRSGLPGAVSRHFFERFGAAMLISVLDAAVQAEVAAQSNGGAVIYDPSGAENVMTEVLKGTVNIAPTVRKQNGDRIQVLVARDLDFRSVYELRPVPAAR